MASNIVSKECLCSFVALLEDAKSAVTGLIDGLIILLTALKTYLLLFSTNLEDEARKLEYTVELEALQAAITTVEIPFRIVLGYTRTFADCAPLGSLTKILKEVRNKVLSPVYEREYEVEQYLLALQDKNNEIAWITRTIDVLNEIKTALDECQE